MPKAIGETILLVENLQTELHTNMGVLRAVDGVSLSLRQGETLGIVGESGCGKTTTAKLLLRLEEPTGGQIFLEGKDIQTFDGQEMKEFRSKVQAVFQDPWSSLSPRMKVKDISSEDPGSQPGCDRQRGVRQGP